MFSSKKSITATQRSNERREREEQAPRLLTSVPGLSSLKISVEDRYGLGTTRHVRHVMVARAPALFVIPCGDATCDSAGHDITGTVMRALYARNKEFSGEQGCDGNVGSAQCSRVVHFRGVAEYKPESAQSHDR
jgi:hypothetical protein